jgi:hypothetical protein
MLHRSLALLLLGLAACGSDSPPKGDGQKPPGQDLFPWRFPETTQPPTGCSPSTCSGCCSGLSCMPGTTTSACGYAGNPCSPCKSGEQCQGGLCVPPPCDATSCKSGCCENGQCKPGTSDKACGAGGDACKACGADETCAENRCEPKGPPMYKITLVSAKVTGSAWIVCGFAELSDCDLYVILKVGSASAQSTVKDNTQNPVWNEYMMTALETSLTKSFEVEVRDDDPIGSVQIGSCSPKVTSSQLSAGKLVTDCGDAKELTFSFQKI